MNLPPAQNCIHNPGRFSLNFEIAGVMKDYNYSSLREEIKPLF